MRGSSSYLDAALAVLREHGKPMHYESIADLAVKLGLLTTTATNYQIAMSSALSKDIRENANSPFAKSGNGLYMLKPSTLSRLLIPIEHDARIRNLEDQLGARKRIIVLRKALFLLQRTCERTRRDHAVILRHNGMSVKVDFCQVVQDARRYSKMDGAVHEQVNREIVVGLERIKRRLSLPSVVCAIHVALELLQHAADLGISENRICTVEAGRC